ncbi:hypothetical protein EV360DRAFT_81638 [Lentinula raphanica]|nr:hypothetical protein EV360DRAFT_81638 [Lentinula raphanica]
MAMPNLHQDINAGDESRLSTSSTTILSDRNLPKDPSRDIFVEHVQRGGGSGGKPGPPKEFQPDEIWFCPGASAERAEP